MNMTTVVIVAAAIHLLARSGIATNVVALVVVVNVTVSGEMENGVESLVTANGPLGIVTDVITKISPRMDAERVSHHSFESIFLDPVAFLLISPLLFRLGLIHPPPGGPRSSDP